MHKIYQMYMLHRSHIVEIAGNGEFAWIADQVASLPTTPILNLAAASKHVGLIKCNIHFLKENLHLYAYACTYACVLINGIRLCFHEKCSLVVIISHAWDVTIILCSCGAIGGSTLFTLAIPCIYGATKVTQHHQLGYGHPNFWLRCAFQPLLCKLYLRPKLL